MDEKKEILPHKGHLKDNCKTLKINDFFRKDPQLFLIFKKTEKLTSAIYLVTDLFYVHEPLRWELRSKSVAFLSFITAQISQNKLCTKGGCIRSQHMLQEIYSLLEIASHTRLISPMNFSILHEEYFSIEDLLHERSFRDDYFDDFSFPERFFSYPDINNSAKDTKDFFYDGQGSKNETGNNKRQKHYKGQNSISFRPLGHLKDKNTLTKKSYTKKGERIKRREEIKSLLRARGELNIKDILLTISDCSEKTLQRELLSLIKEGVIEKKGERRWSTYILISDNFKDQH